MEKKTLEFRTLQAGEIDCRIATVTEKGVSLLLYKDARVDQNILDETVGPMNWQRAHSRDNANCTVSIWDGEKQQWISKEDTGTESLPPTPLSVPALTGGLDGNCIQRHLSGFRPETAGSRKRQTGAGRSGLVMIGFR